MSELKNVEVVAALIVKDSKVLIAQRGYGDYKGKWEFPGGKIEKGESKEDALKREIKEELNADINVLDFLYTVNYDYEKFHLIMHTYFCELLSDHLELVYHDDEKLEHDNVMFVNVEDLDKIDFLPADIEVVKILKEK